MDIFNTQTIIWIIVAVLCLAISEWLKSINGPFIIFIIAAIFSFIASFITARVTVEPPKAPTATQNTSSNVATPTMASIPSAEAGINEEELVKTAYAGILAPASDFLFPYSSTSYLSNSELNEVMESDDRYAMRSISQRAINEIFARYGYTFSGTSQTSREAKNLFEGKDWYEEARKRCVVQPGEQYKLLENYFNDYERSNIETINQWQIEHNVPDLDE